MCNEPGNEGGLTETRPTTSILYLSHQPQTQSINIEWFINTIIVNYIQSLAVPVRAAKSRRRLLPDRSPLYARLSITQ